MSYYLTLIGTRDNPLYETEIVSKTLSGSSADTSSSSSAASSFFGSSIGAASSTATAGEGSGMFGGLLSRLPTAASNTTPTPPRTSSSTISNGAKRKQRYELQMIAHSALDTIEDALATSGYLYLKSIDRIQEFTTSCFVVPGNIKFVLLHEHRHEEGIKNFFLEIWEAYLKVSLNPFQDAIAPINNPTFEGRVRIAARKFL